MKLEILDFTAAWCGPCKTLRPILHAVAGERQIPVTEIDVDHDPVRAQAMQIKSMPTVVILADGVEVGRIVGARNKHYVSDQVDRAIQVASSRLAR